MNFFERLENVHITSWKKKDLAITKCISEILKECVFEPNKHKAKRVREFKEFIKDQKRCNIKLMTHVFDLLKEARYNEYTKCKDKPTINNTKGIHSKVASYINSHNSSPVRSSSRKDLTRDTSPTLIRFKSGELGKNELNVINRLYKHDSKKTLKENYTCINDKSVINKFKEEYSNTLKTLNIQSNSFIDFNTMREIMTKMGFTHSDFANETQKRELNQFLKQIFSSLSVNKTSKVNTTRLMILIAGILNIQLEDNKPQSETLNLHNKYKELYLLRNVFKKATFNSPYKKQSKVELKSEPYHAKPKSVYDFMYKRDVSYTPDIHITRKLLKPQKKSCNKEGIKLMKTAQLTYNKPKKQDPIIEKIIEQKKKRKEDKERVRSLIEGKNVVKERKPILNIEINCEDITEVLLVYKGDTVEQLANTFSNKHRTLPFKVGVELNDYAREMLRQMIKEQMSKVMK